MFLFIILFLFFSGNGIAHCSLDNREFGVCFLAGKSDVYVFEHSQVGSGTHPNFLSKEYRVLLLGI
jgi:hypothetical protein